MATASPLIELSVNIEITEDMACETVAPPTECKPGGTNQFGFSFQLNCHQPKATNAPTSSTSWLSGGIRRAASMSFMVSTTGR
jgi:hypothetical protein